MIKQPPNQTTIAYVGELEFYDGSAIKVSSLVFSESGLVAYMWIDNVKFNHPTKMVALARNEEDMRSNRFWPFQKHRFWSVQIIIRKSDIIMAANGTGHLFIRGEWYEFPPKNSRTRMVPPEKYSFMGILVGKYHFSPPISAVDESEILSRTDCLVNEKIMTL